MIKPNTIAFCSMNTEWVMRITADRRIEVADGVDVTEAARLVLDAMQSMLDVGLEKAVLAEREACADLLEHGYIDDEGHHLQYAKEIRARGQT
jgi:hypothetical protein